MVLGLIFLRYLSYAFGEKRKKIKEEKSKISPAYVEKLSEDRDVYLANGTLYVPKEARWDYITEHANQVNIGEIIDNAIEILEKEHPKHLKDVIPKIFSSVNLDHHDFYYLINLFSQIEFGDEHWGKDIFGRIYEYFLGKFTEAEGKKGGEFYTPRSLTRLIVEILDVREGRIFDPACGSGGFLSLLWRNSKMRVLRKKNYLSTGKNQKSLYGRCVK